MHPPIPFVLCTALVACSSSSSPLHHDSRHQAPPAPLASAPVPIASGSATAAQDSPEVPVAAPESPTLLPLPQTAPPSQRLARAVGELFNPLPGGVLGGYRGDTGLDIGASKLAVYALADGTLDYSEPGHTRWTGKSDSPYTIRLAIDHPIPFRGRKITHVYYGHLSAIDVTQPEGTTPRYHVRGGQRLGVSGRARGAPHLHLGLLLDGDVSQSTWDNILTESQVREVLGGYKNGQKL